MLELEEYSKYGIALTGCHATRLAYECCEYDLIVLNDCSEGVIMKNNKYFEIHKVSKSKSVRTLQLYNAIIINDPSLMLSALKDGLNPKMLEIYSKGVLIDALLDASKAMMSSRLEASFLLKRSAYNYLTAILLSKKIIPSPLHILTQLRELEVDLTLPLECLGIERANSSSIMRALDILHQFIDSRLVSKKAFYLYDKHKYVDCNLYLTYLAINQVKNSYHDMINRLAILVDLSNDEHTIERLASLLFTRCKEMMKSY